MVQLVKLDGVIYEPNVGKVRVLFHVDALSNEQRNSTCREIFSPKFESRAVKFTRQYMIACSFPDIQEMWDDFQVIPNLQTF